MIMGMWLLLMAFAACSMQKSGSKIDATALEGGASKSEQRANKSALKELTPLRIDYLTPLDSINKPELYVYKEKRRMYVMQANVLVRDYPIGLGFNPRGDKQRGGDGKTPEGDFVICVKNRESRFVKSLGLNYPDKRRAEQAMTLGLISPIEFRNIIASLDRLSLPPSNTALGGQIFIHAGGAHKDWTNGCIALYDRDMEELFVMAKEGTPVSIRP